jgi:DNA processing protein
MVGRRTPLTGASEEESLLALRLLPGVGDLGVIRLLLRRGSAREVWNFPQELASAGRPETREALALPGRLLERARSIRERCAELGIRIVGFLDDGYPSLLHHLHDPPPVLFMVGDAGILERPLVAIVGCRKATATGRRTARRMAGELSLKGMGVVSGMALGIDGAAHLGALEGPGGTVAVLGRGPDRAYPLANAGLYRAVARHGLLVSEFPPGEKARPHHFPRRNRIIAALAWGVVVVEAGRRSGALITVDHALDLGREIMAVPGSVEWEQTRGTHELIRNLDCIVTSARQILGRVPWASLEVSALSPELLDVMDREKLKGSSRPQRVDGKLQELVGSEPLPLEVILDRSGLPASRTLAALTRLEVSGRFRREPEGWVRVGP